MRPVRPVVHHGALLIACVLIASASQPVAAAVPPSGAITASDSASAAPSAHDSTLTIVPASQHPASGTVAADSLGGHASAPDSLGPRLTERAVLASTGADRGEVLDPSGVAVDAFGRVYVSDVAAHRVIRLDPGVAKGAEFGSLGSDAQMMRRPSGVALLGTLGVAVLDRDNQRILSYDLFGRPLGTLVDLASDALERVVGRIDPIALASDRGGALMLIDRERDRVLAFDFSGRYLRAIGGLGSKPGSFRALRGIAITPHGELVTADRGNARVQRLDASGRAVVAWSLSVGPGEAALPIAVDGNGRVAVADETSGRLWLFSPSGTLLLTADGLTRPRAMAFAPDGTLLVAEGAPARVRRFAFEGVPASSRE